MLLGFLLAVVVASWSLGVFRTVRSVYLGALEERARLAEAEREERARRAARDERARIAREMHDVVAHSLSVIVSQAQGGAYVAGAQPERAAKALETIAETGREALADMRGLLGVLRADPDAAEPAPADPQPGLADVPELVARVRAAGLLVALTEAGTPRRLGAAAGLAAYRLVQESLTNTLKHAGAAARAEVRLCWTEEELVVEVIDDGRGGRRCPPRRRAGAGRDAGAGRGGRRHARGRPAARAAASRWRPGFPVGRARMIRVFLVDDQELVRAGFAMVLDAQPDMRVVGEAGGRGGGAWRRWP